MPSIYRNVTKDVAAVAGMYLLVVIGFFLAGREEIATWMLIPLPLLIVARGCFTFMRIRKQNGAEAGQGS